MSPQVAIIGGGLTGLVAAEQLARRGVEGVVFEREPEPGGACRSEQVGEYIFDHTGHLLHVGQTATEEYLRELGVWTQLELHERVSSVVIGGCFTPYPVQIHTHGLRPEQRRDCLLGFIRAWAAEQQQPADFAQWVESRFGTGLARHFFFPYNQKLYRTRPADLSVDWVDRYVPQPDLEEVVDGALGLHRERVGYNAVFRYPRRGGIRLLPDSVAARVPNLRLTARVATVDLAARRLTVVDGSEHHFEALVHTGSLPGLVDMVQGPLPAEVVEARAALRWVRVVGLCLGIAGEASRPEHWLYFPDPELPFYRVGFPSNHGRVAPSGCHTMTAELSLDPGSGDPMAEADRAVRALVELGLLNAAAIQERHLTVIDPAYVVFDHHRRQAVEVLRRFFRAHGVWLAGRWAEWKYSAMEDAILDGMNVAQRCIAAQDAQ